VKNCHISAAQYCDTIYFLNIAEDLCMFDRFHNEFGSESYLRARQFKTHVIFVENCHISSAQHCDTSYGIFLILLRIYVCFTRFITSLGPNPTFRIPVPFPAKRGLDRPEPDLQPC
jgi:hypothetical protein